MVIFQVLSTVGSFASIFAFAFMFWPEGQSLTSMQIILLVAGVSLLLVAVAIQVFYYWRNMPHAFTKELEIRDYMYQWISKGSRVTIFSNDMSWVRDQEMKDLLRLKAGREELCLCLPREIPLSQELKREGAQVFVYSDINYVPLSRFTIINSGRMDAQVAVGRRIGGKHVIEEFSQGQHPCFFIANDLIGILTSFVKLNEASKQKS